LTGRTVDHTHLTTMNDGPNYDGRTKRYKRFVRDIHSESFYKRLESDGDGLIDLRVMERDEEAKNSLRVRSLKGQPHDARWRDIQIKRNGEATLVS